MNFPDLTLLPDVQSTADSRRLAIDRVGIRGLKYPMQVVDVEGEPQATVVEADLSVELDATVKGTHMSRFVALLEGRGGVLSVGGIDALLADMTALLDARAGRIEFRFPYFVRKAAPVSGVLSVMDYQVTLGGNVRDGRIETTLAIVAPVTSLCPCSKEIAEYGAHNQRSHITIAVRLGGNAAQGASASRIGGSAAPIARAAPLGIGELIRIAEDEASSELYGLLKRPDEKFVTERAYDNPKFVEDLVRDIAARLDRDPRIAGYRVESENFESIHNHSAYAMIRKDFGDA